MGAQNAHHHPQLDEAAHASEHAPTCVRADAAHAADDVGHSHAQREGLLGRLQALAVPHSHGSGDRVDAALEASRDGLRCLTISFAALMLTALAQTAIVFYTNSAALLGDTLHNYADALTAVPLAIAFVVGRRRASRRYTYGYGRAEDLAGMVVVVVIAASAALAGYVAVDRLAHPQDVRHLPALAAAGLIGFLGNEVVAQYRVRTGRRIGSAALVADGLHARTDGFTSLAVVVGAVGAAVGVPLADPIVGLLLTAAILVVLRDAAREVFGRLMDAVDPALVDRAETVIRSTPGVQDVSDVWLRWHGHSLRAEARIVVDTAMTVVEAHHLAHTVEHELLHGMPRLAAAIIHPEPSDADSAAAHHLIAHHSHGSAARLTAPA